MKNVLLIMVVLFAGLNLALAQESTSEALPTLAEVVVAATQGEAPEFTTLLAAVEAADPTVLGVLANPALSPRVTVFAPTDQAFADLQGAIGEEAFNAILADPAQLTEVLLYHVAPGYEDAQWISTTLMTRGGAFSLPTTNGQHLDVALDGDKVMVDGATVITTDIQASNGVIHVIDRVMLPELRTIGQILGAKANTPHSPEFTTLLTAVDSADPAVLATLADPEASITLFAPTDAAFAAFDATRLQALLMDRRNLTEILLYHVLPQEVSTVTIYDEPLLLGEATTSEGTFFNTAYPGNRVTIHFMLDRGGFRADVNRANILRYDIDAVNGVIHIIDTVLRPDSER